MGASDTIDRPRLRGLICDYVNRLDRGPLGEWPSFFVEDGRYRITTRENEARGFPLSILLCNNRAMLFDRIESIEKANVYEPHYYRHILSDTEYGGTGDVVTMRTSFICVRTMLNGESMLFVSGEYLDEVVEQDGRLLYRSKTVVLDQSRIDTLIAVPL